MVYDDNAKKKELDSAISSVKQAIESTDFTHISGSSLEMGYQTSRHLQMLRMDEPLGEFRRFNSQVRNANHNNYLLGSL